MEHEIIVHSSERHRHVNCNYMNTCGTNARPEDVLARGHVIGTQNFVCAAPEILRRVVKLKLKKGSMGRGSFFISSKQNGNRSHTKIDR